MQDSFYSDAIQADKISADLPGETDCANPRRSFLIRIASAATAVPALAMMGASKPKTKPKQGRPPLIVEPDKKTPRKVTLPDLYGGWNARNFDNIRADETAHVTYLVNSLGSAARPKPNFQNLVQTDPFVFAGMARNFENTGTAAYLGALPLLVGTPYLTAAAAIALTEARHSGYLNVLINFAITENIAGVVTPFEGPLTPDQVVANISSYVVDLNGGPPLIPAGGLVQPTDVLNFALALEYLESEYYNLNVAKFFS